MARPQLSVIIPTYNERENLESLVAAIDLALKGRRYELIIVDDGSPDGTAAIAQALARTYSITVLVRPGKLGLATAVIDGLKLAAAERICVMDADHSHPPELLPKLDDRQRRTDADVVVASRYLAPASHTWAANRELISRCATWPARALTKISDPMSGFFLFRRKLLAGVQLKPRGYKILLEILVRARPERVIEQPFVFQARRSGQTKLNTKVMADYLIQLGQLSWYRLRQ